MRFGHRFTFPALGARRGAGAPTVLSRAVAAWLASDYEPGASGIPNRGTGGAGEVRLGSTSEPDTNDPLFLPYDGTRYCYFPGVTGNYASVSAPSALAGLDSGVLSLRVEVHHDTWRPSSAEALLGANNIWLTLYLQSDGTLRLRARDEVLGSIDIVSASIDAGAARRWVRVDYSFSAQEATFYSSADGVAWTTLGAPVASTFAQFTTIGVTALTVGDRSTGGGNTLSGSVYRAQWMLDATILRDIDFTLAAAYNASLTSLTAVTGQTVTLNRSASGRKLAVVDRPMFLLGTDDYRETADHASLNCVGVFTAVSTIRVHGTPAASQSIIAKRAGGGTAIGCDLLINTSRAIVVRLGDGSSNVAATSAALTEGKTYLVALVRDGADQVSVYVNDGTGGTLTAGGTLAGDLSNSEVLRHGRLAGITSAYLNACDFGDLIFQEALTLADLDQLYTEVFG